MATKQNQDAVMDEKTEMAIEITAASLANKTTVCGAAAGFVGWLTQVNWIGLTGAMVAVVGLLVSVYFQWRRDKRETELNHVKIRSLIDACEVDDEAA